MGGGGQFFAILCGRPLWTASKIKHRQKNNFVSLDFFEFSSSLLLEYGRKSLRAHYLPFFFVFFFQVLLLHNEGLEENKTKLTYKT